MKAYFEKLAKYETWATGLALDSIDSVPALGRHSAQYQRALEVMAHIQIARKTWLGRIQNRVEAVDNWFPEWPTDTTRTAAAALDRAWGDVISALSPQDASRVVRYASTEGVAYESELGDILTHVFNHSTYHRGQVARLVNEAGGKRAATDFIAQTRRKA